MEALDMEVSTTRESTPRSPILSTGWRLTPPLCLLTPQLPCLPPPPCPLLPCLPLPCHPLPCHPLPCHPLPCQPLQCHLLPCLRKLHLLPLCPQLSLLLPCPVLPCNDLCLLTPWLKSIHICQ